MENERCGGVGERIRSSRDEAGRQGAYGLPGGLRQTTTCSFFLFSFSFLFFFTLSKLLFYVFLKLLRHRLASRLSRLRVM